MLKKNALSLLLIINGHWSNAQNAYTPIAFVYNRLEAYKEKESNAFSARSNQALLATATKASAGFAMEHRFLLKDLAVYKVATAIPTSSGSFSFNGDFLKAAGHRNIRLGLGHGRRVGSALSVGVQFNYHHLSVPGYGSARAVDVETGILFNMSKTLHVSFHLLNPTRSRYNKGNEEALPVLYTTGLGYQPGEHFYVGADIQKGEGTPLSFSAGCHYTLEKMILARVGFSSHSGSYYLGASVLLSAFRLDLTASLHPQLGVTPGLLILFNQGQ